MPNDTAHAALLVMDVQRGVVERVTRQSELLGRLARAIEAARGVRIPVVFVRVAFRGGYPEVSGRNKTFTAVTSRAGATFLDTNEATQIHPEVAARAEDPVVVKKR